MNNINKTPMDLEYITFNYPDITSVNYGNMVNNSVLTNKQFTNSVMHYVDDLLKNIDVTGKEKMINEFIKVMKVNTLINKFKREFIIKEYDIKEYNKDGINKLENKLEDLRKELFSISIDNDEILLYLLEEETL